MQHSDPDHSCRVSLLPRRPSFECPSVREQPKTSPRVKTVLLIAFHFPPLTGSSGIQRTLRFAQYLPAFGWRPVVLTVTTNCYESIDVSSNSLIPRDCEVIRLPALDTARHLSVGGRYLRAMSMPDRWASWVWLGKGIATRHARRLSADAIWSTYPIASAHLLASAIARETGLPWLADFRDPMAQENYPEDPERRRHFLNIESAAAKNASRLIFVTEGALQTYRHRFPEIPDNHFCLIENGYDENVFQSAEKLSSPSMPIGARGRPFVLLHSGIIYPKERDPRNLFVAIARLASAGIIHEGDFLLRFRAAVHNDLLTALAREHSVERFCEIAPPISYQHAIREMLQVDGLLLMQGNDCNDQIPAKSYEYLRSGRPILCLADPAGDTGRLLTSMGCRDVAALESVDDISSALDRFLHQQRIDAQPWESQVIRFSREHLTKRLALLLSEATEHKRA